MELRRSFGGLSASSSVFTVRQCCFVCFVLCCWLSIPEASAGIVNNIRDRIRGNSADRGDGQTVRHGQLTPLIVIPGDGGSQLEAWLNKPGVVNSLCPSKTNGWSRVWVDFAILVPTLTDCWIDNLRLYYNDATRKSENAPGVQIRVPGFGDTDTIEYLTKVKLPQCMVLRRQL
ncbi:hypothetical protein RvY_17273-2 [Ramazzottius varieornatus]|uniref:Uncharacterized protein n=1 Tax=Ramazzottius varieornatus TaxID=947166 RepID=A0A1D1W1K4_RAMVA|nr:hypothetical protein RvY_17273-2 [Ramazzottius varieornatus]